MALYALLYRWSTASADGAPNGGPLAGVIPRWGVGLLIGTVLGVTGITLAQRYQQAQHHAAIHLGLMLQAKQAQLTDWHEERLNDARLLSQRRGLREGWDAWREAPDAPPPPAMRHALEQALELGRYRAAGIVDGQGHAFWVGAVPPDPQGLIPQAATRVLDTTSTARAWIDADSRWQWIFVANLPGMAYPAALVLALDDVNITLSIGIAVLPTDGDDTPLDVLRRADTALRRAKERGGHQSVFFDDAMGAAVARRFTIEQELRRALAADELRLYLQPQADAQGHWRAAEALVRCQHPMRGLVPPAEFVPVAEGCDLIEPLGHWVLQAACAHLGQLARAGTRLPIAVNVSPRQFHRPHFVQEVLDALRTHGAAAADLVLEVTEGVVVEDIDAVIERMLALTREGVRFSIDDFGTGYSSLSYLKRLPIQEIKIDRSFVRDAPNDPDDAALVEAIIAVAERLRLRVVAEGVETAEQAAFFGRWPHVLQQGYLHGRPDAAEAVLARWRASQTGEPAAGAGGMT